MTPSSENLRQLWQSGPASAVHPKELWLKLEKKARRFDRTIRWRDVREAVAGVFITVLYSWRAWHAGTTLYRVADWWLAACGVWIIFYLLRYSRLTRKPAPDLALAVYRRELLERYDQQIRLLKNAKYWYVLPFWIGLMLTAFAELTDGKGMMVFVLMALSITAANAAVWWANEGPGVRYVRRQREELAQLIGEEGESK